MAKMKWDKRWVTVRRLDLNGSRFAEISQTNGRWLAWAEGERRPGDYASDKEAMADIEGLAAFVEEASKHDYGTSA